MAENPFDLEERLRREGGEDVSLKRRKQLEDELAGEKDSFALKGGSLLSGIGEAIAGEKPQVLERVAQRRKELEDEKLGRFDRARQAAIRNLELSGREEDRQRAARLKEAAEGRARAGFERGKVLQGREDTAYGREEQEYGALRDPNDPRAVQARQRMIQVGQKLGLPTQGLENLGYKALTQSPLYKVLPKMPESADPTALGPDGRPRPKLSPTVQKQIDDLGGLEDKSRQLQEESARALQALREYGQSTTAGTGLGAALKSLGGPLSPETQGLQAQFNKVGLRAVASFAAEAGARGIDSNAERAFLETTLPNIGKDDRVNEQILIANMSQAARAQLLARARQQHILENGSLVGFDPIVIDESVQSLFSPETGKVVLVGKEDEVPPGFVPTNELLFPSSGGRVAAGEGPAPRPVQEGMVRLQDPGSGRVFDVPQDQAQELIEQRGLEPVDDSAQEELEDTPSGGNFLQQRNQRLRSAQEELEDTPSGGNFLQQRNQRLRGAR